MRCALEVHRRGSIRTVNKDLAKLRSVRRWSDRRGKANEESWDLMRDSIYRKAHRSLPSRSCPRQTRINMPATTPSSVHQRRSSSTSVATC
jgi:hypothetical protein